MSFFERAAAEVPDPPTPPPRPPTPEWFEPPSGVVPGQSMQQAIVFATDRTFLSIRQFDVYPQGVEFSIDLQVRSTDEWLEDTPWELNGRHGERTRAADALPDEFLRLGFEFADGSTWSNLAFWYPAFDERPDRPVLIGRGGGGGGDRWQMRYWMWPLPPGGDIVVHAAWPRFDIEAVTATIDGTALRRASEAARRVWE